MASGSQLAPSSPLPHPLLEAKEDEHLHVRASSSSSAILPPPPRLPYDLTYPPLSPLGVDQNGHSLALQHPEQAAQVARAALMGTAATANGSLGAQQAVASSSSPAALQNGTANGGAEPSSKSSRTGAVTSHTASRHTPHEKPKKALPGQELEQHLVSEARGQRPMPWGLQVTLAEKAAAVAAQNGLAAQPTRTRMGTQKRNASRESRGGKLGLQSASPAPAARLMTADEDTASEFEASPRPPLLELQSEEKNKSLSLTPSEEPNGAQERRESGKSHSHDTLMTTLDPGVAIGKRPLADTDQQSIAGPSTPRQSSPSVAAKDVLRSKKSRSSLKDVGAADHSMTGEGDDSIDSITGVRRPRAAHKRLKMMGGYYGKNAKVAALDEEVSAAKQPTVKAEADSNGGEPIGRVSRATSSAVEEDSKIGRVAPIVAPTTPVKKPHQPSLSVGILNSASKAQSSKLVIAASGASASVVDNTDGNNEYCETCHGVGHFICCDGCPRSFHFACLNPPMDIDELPSMAGDAGDEWYCNACASQRQAKSAGKAAQKRTLFGPLLRYIEEENPSIFSLPQDIRNYFKGVATANDGSYIDSTMLRPLKINKFGFVDERDPLRLKDRNGKLVLCYHCGQSALPAEKTTPLRRNSPRKSQSKEDVLASGSTGDDDRTGWRKIIGCDFCSLHWHLDCLDPPLASMPSMARKWMCPNHVDHVVRPVRVPKNVANSTSVHDLPVPSIRSVGPGKHYRLRVINDGQIDIIPDPMDTYFGNHGIGSSSNSTTAINGHDKKDEASSSSSRLTSSISGPAENRGRGLDKGWEEQDIPTNANGSGKATQSQQIKFKYRLPEKVIRLDFWSRAALERERTLAQLVQRREEQARLPLDTLALAANAAAAANADGHDAASSAALADVEAKALVDQVFGAHSARPLFPALGVDDDDDDDDGKVSFRDAEGNTWLESTLRQTYEPGVFEREAEAHAAALISPAHTQPAAKTMRWTRAMQEAKEKAEREAALDVAVDEATASAMQVDFDELKQLRAVKALLDRRGAKDVMQFLLQ